MTPGIDTRVVETHVSTLFFVGDRVYKLKKPVAFGFLDFTSREARQSACEREVELNRRLAPDVYLGVATVLGPDGLPCDHLVVMRRMPADRRLSTLVTTDGNEVAEELRRLARMLADFHARAATGPTVTRFATTEAVRRLWDDNLAELVPFAGGPVASDALALVGELARRYVDGRSALFETRIAAGAARDGHGDLLADDIFCLDDGPRVLDCLEFDDRLRCGDVLLDVAFLAMDLERLGRSDLAGAFLSSYEEFAGARYPASLLEHYIAYRALVRAKVTCIRHAQTGEAEAATEADRLLGIAVGHLWRSRPRLVLVGGLPGTGKTTLATALTSPRGWTLLRSDEVRKELAGLPHTRPAPAGYRGGLYTPEATDAVYAEMLRRARRLLEMGEIVVLDASWAAARHRDAARDLGRAVAADVMELRCDVPTEVAAQRLGARVADASDADPAVAATMAADVDPWPEAALVDTSGTPDRAVLVAQAIVDEARGAVHIDE